MHSSQEKTSVSSFCIELEEMFIVYVFCLFVPEQHERHCENLIAVINSTLPFPLQSPLQFKGPWDIWTAGQPTGPMSAPRTTGNSKVYEKYYSFYSVYHSSLYNFCYAVQGTGSPYHPTGLMPTLSPAGNDEVLLYLVL